MCNIGLGRENALVQLLLLWLLMIAQRCSARCVCYCLTFFIRCSRLIGIWHVPRSHHSWLYVMVNIAGCLAASSDHHCLMVTVDWHLVCATLPPPLIPYISAVPTRLTVPTDISSKYYSHIYFCVINFSYDVTFGLSVIRLYGTLSIYLQSANPRIG